MFSITRGTTLWGLSWICFLGSGITASSKAVYDYYENPTEESAVNAFWNISSTVTGRCNPLLSMTFAEKIGGYMYNYLTGRR